jgi:tight adherence protein B
VIDAGATIPLAALAGGLVALAVREGLAAAPAGQRWLAAAVEPLMRAGREGYEPSEAERRRLALLGSALLLGTVLLLAGPGPLALLALAGPAAAGSLLSRRRRRYRLAIESRLPEVATALADALAAGHSVRAALAAAPGALDGPPAAELGRVAADLELGGATVTALEGMRSRVRSERLDALAAALVAQQASGGDLVGLLRRFATAAAEQAQAARDARTATAQARFTGLLVVAMPSGAALFAELLNPGFVARLLAAPGGAVILAMAAALQLGGFMAIRRLARAEP